MKIFRAQENEAKMKAQTAADAAKIGKPAAPQSEPTVRIGMLTYYAPDCPTCGARHGNAHRGRDCAFPCDEPSAPQPTADDVVRAVREAFGAAPAEGDRELIERIDWQIECREPLTTNTVEGAAAKALCNLLRDLRARLAQPPAEPEPAVPQPNADDVKEK